MSTTPVYVFDAVSESRLSQVHPILAARVRKFAAQLGFQIRVTQGKRSPEEQDALWSQGRFPIGQVNALRSTVGWAPLPVAENVIVTHAPPGFSWHEYGLSADVVPMTPLPDWNESHPDWTAIVTGARSCLLLDGISFEDEPHLQPIELPVSPTPLYRTLLAKGLPTVWEQAGLAA